ncbi:MAG: LysR family transcriptional regulator [Sulfurospirillaceae bacterium]|nr:LysR family transcriptional regulator [Sulfurospirillaceae bacterium]
MLKDFSKIETFLTVVKEKSFSKASKKLGISQPAVTQQIKLLEDYLETKIVDRKKNGIKLTKSGEELYKVAQKLEKCINSAEREIIKLVNKEMIFVLGASFMIGNYLLPEFLNEIQEAIKNDVMLKVDNSEEMTNQLLDKKIDLALLESPIFTDTIIYREWMEDELVVASRSPLPKILKKDDLFNYAWICREEESHTRKIIHEAFDTIGVDCQNFKLKSIVTSSTAVKQTLLKSQIEEYPTVSIISKHIIADEVENGTLHCAKVKGLKLTRMLYLAYSKERKHDAFMDSVISYIMSKRRI